MTADFIQHAIVTLVAVGAAWVVVRRVFTTVVPPAGGGAPKCASCPSAQAHKTAQPLSSEPKPLTLIR